MLGADWLQVRVLTRGSASVAWEVLQAFGLLRYVDEIWDNTGRVRRMEVS